jgi:hypothetical protein
LGYGVIGSTTDSGSVSLGSSPGTPAETLQKRSDKLKTGAIPRAPSSSGLGRRPLKAVARVQIPSGLREWRAMSAESADLARFAFSSGGAAPRPRPEGLRPPDPPTPLAFPPPGRLSSTQQQRDQRPRRRVRQAPRTRPAPSASGGFRSLGNSVIKATASADSGRLDLVLALRGAKPLAPKPARLPASGSPLEHSATT